MQDVKDTHEDVEAAPQATDSEKVTADQAPADAGSEEGDKAKEQPKPKVPFCALYRYATTSDMVQVGIGFLGSGLMGAIMPAFAVGACFASLRISQPLLARPAPTAERPVFGDVLDELATADNVAEAVVLPVILYACVAVASWLFSGVSVAPFHRTKIGACALHRLPRSTRSLDMLCLAQLPKP